MKHLEARLRLVSGELVLIGNAERGELELHEEQDGKRRPIGKLTLARPEELAPLFERLTEPRPEPAPSAEMAPFQPPPEEAE